jgi:RHS repeat-associated protein
VAEGSAVSSMQERAPEPARQDPLATPSISLPKGGGAIRGIGEKFGANPVTGTGSMSVPIATSPGRSGFGPQLSLTYDSGAGNGPFGFGWSLSLPSITRKTDKGLPQYFDVEDSDVFILSGAEDLVPVYRQDPDGTWVSQHPGFQRDADGFWVRDPAGSLVVHVDELAGYRIHRYRPRTEGLFARIERWTKLSAPGDVHWRSISKDNILTLYGFDENSRIADPLDASRIYSWLICETRDDKGNAALYRYKAEDGLGVDPGNAHERNRGPQNDARRTANRYIKRIHYGNRTSLLDNTGGRPRFLDTTQIDAQIASAGWMFEVVFDYGEHDAATPTPGDAGAWNFRPDPFSSYRPGFEVRTTRLCQRVLMFHHFPGTAQSGVGINCLVRSTDFTYSDELDPTDVRNPVYTFLEEMTQTGYRRNNGGYDKRSLPPVEFEYAEPVVQEAVEEVDPESLENLPAGLDGSAYRWTDLHGEGIPGILTEQGGAWFYKRNVSPVPDRLPDGREQVKAQFAPLETVALKPNVVLGGGAEFMDLAGDGQPDVVVMDGPAPGLYEHDEAEGWQPFRPFTSHLNRDMRDPNLKFIDLDGDGHADVLITEGDALVWHASLAEEGFGPARRVAQALDEERGPLIVFADGTQSIYLADLSGDGLTDIARIRNGEVCYWPNLGYGRFGAKITMDSAPWFDNPDQFDHKHIRLADIDGSGTTDIIYLHRDGVRLYFNQSGNSWSKPQQLKVFPRIDDVVSIVPTDLLGNGTACLVWSSPLPANARQQMRYVNLMGGRKPHLLVRTINNLGAETRADYAPSTKFYLQDKRDGKPWITRLPFPVHVVERVETYDHISRSRFVTRYAYHHGYFDGEEREFRGFGMVEQWDTEEHREDTVFPTVDDTNWDHSSWSPPVHTRSWFHTGAFLQARSVSRQYAHEYWIEPALRPEARAADRRAMELPDSVITSDTPMSAFELQEAYRALKGLALRVEVYSDDGSPLAANPYSIAKTNYTVERRQPIGQNKHAVFYAHPRETLTFHYERQPDDPRVTHEVTLETDPFGNTKRAVSIGYPRRAGYAEPEPALSAQFRGMLAYDQTRLHIVATEHRYTNDLADPATTPDVHRTPMPSQTTTGEWTGLAPTPKGTAITDLFSFGELDAAWSSVSDLASENIPRSDVDGSGQVAAAPARRMLSQARTLYRKDDLTGLCGPGQLESLALPGDTFTLALTPALAGRVFGTRVSDAMLQGDGGYAHFPPPDVPAPAPDANWWIPAGRVFYSPGDTDTPVQELAEARAHFYLPRRAVAPFGGIGRVSYAYDLLAASTVDAVGNTLTVTNDFRVLQPAQITDANGNRSAVAFDALGLVAGTAVMGKTSESLGDSLAGFAADLDDATVQAQLADPLANPGAVLGSATTRLIYDLFAYDRTRNDPQPSPGVVYLLARETHVSDLADGQTRYQHALSYSDGFGREIQKKVLAKPGPLAPGGPVVTPRWIATGWTIFNNKGKPVRTYEPFFTATPRFEFANTVGVSTVMLYDSADRVVATVRPDQTWTKVVFDAWRQESWDVNDTVLIADPRTDADVGDRFTRLLGAAPGAWTSWHGQRIGGALGAAEQAAAKNTEPHAGTPAVAHVDSLGRACLAIADNGKDGRYPTRTANDAENQPLAIFDALGRRVFEYCLREPAAGGDFQYVAGHDLAGHELYHCGMDGGQRRMLSDVSGKPIRAWDALGRAFELRYDLLRRPTHRYVTVNATTILLERSIYGEGMASQNLCGRLFRQYDQAGLASHDAFDYKGNLVGSTRQLAAEYRNAVDWTVLANLTDPAALDAAAKPKLVDADWFSAASTYDALNRVIQTVTPHNATMKPNVIRPAYNEANLLDRIDVWQQQPTAPAGLLDPATATLHAVTGIEYDAHGKRTAITSGNATVTTYAYDPLTFRLTRLVTTRPSSFPANARTVQDLTYAYDPAGNITHIQDDADIQNVVYFRNQRVEPSSDYGYDAIYRLATATGREHLGQTNAQLNPPQQVTDDDGFRTGQLPPGDGNAMGTYTEKYQYDSVGNLLALTHAVSSGSWTRRYAYREPSQITAAETNNRLTSTSLPGDLAAGPYSATYAHDAHGNMTRMPHLPVMAWDEFDHLRSTTRQVVTNATPETFYNYDSGGARGRKVTDRQAPAGQTGTRAKERIYLGGLELYREYQADGVTVKLARETLHLSDGPNRIALVETRTQGTDKGLPVVVRYQHGNHLGSAMLELDDAANVITYEEYFPYGSTSYQSVRSQTETPKRYRYTGKERDEESSFYHNGARYYAPWLGRWLSVDPKGMTDGAGLFTYVRDNPIAYIDPEGTDLAVPDPNQVRQLRAQYDAFRSFDERANFLRSLPPQQQQAIAGGKASASVSATFNKIETEHLPNWWLIKDLATATIIGAALVVGGLGPGPIAPVADVAGKGLGLYGAAHTGVATGEALTGTDIHGRALSDREQARALFHAVIGWLSLGVGAAVSRVPVAGGRMAAPSTASGVIETGPVRNPVIQDTPKVLLGDAAEDTGGGLTRVGRWMSPAEHEAMTGSGMVQEGGGGTTYVAHPADSAAYGQQAAAGSRYVEFDVPRESLAPYRGKEGWAQIPGPNSLYGRLAVMRGLPSPEFPSALNIEWLLTK